MTNWLELAIFRFKNADAPGQRILYVNYNDTLGTKQWLCYANDSPFFFSTNLDLVGFVNFRWVK